MRLPISLMSFLVGASVPALAITLSGKVIDQSGAGKAGVVVSFQGATAKTGVDGTWSIPVPDGSAGISRQLSNGRQVITGGGHLVLDEGHLRVSLSGYDLMGRPRSANSTTLLPSETVSGISARRQVTSGIDTFQYLWNGNRFLRDTASVSRSGIIAIFDTTANDSIIYGWLTDARDSQVYRTVKIGSQTWMAQNLNYVTDSSWRAAYGRLYQWAAAMDLASTYNSTTWDGNLPHQGICPSGWHVPSDAEWSLLVQYVDSASSGTKLKANSSLWSMSIGYDAYGFSILPAGFRYWYDGEIENLGFEALFWSSFESDASHAYNREVNSDNPSVGRLNSPKLSGSSLRCISSSDSSTSNSSNTSTGDSASGTFTDTRDGQSYKYVKIGTQTWMAQNLNYKVDSSWCPVGVASNCVTYGRLYQWAAAMGLASTYNSTAWDGNLPHQGICPSGWHVPSDAEWSTLVQYVDSASSGTKLKANSSLWITNTGTDAYGFSVLPAGLRYNEGAFYSLGGNAAFWSSSEITASNARNRYFYYNNANINRYDYNDKLLDFSLRCIEN